MYQTKMSSFFKLLCIWSRVHLAFPFLCCDQEALSRLCSQDNPIVTLFAALVSGIIVLPCLFCSLSKNCCFVVVVVLHFGCCYIRQKGKSSPRYSTMLDEEVTRSQKVPSSEVRPQGTGEF